MSLATVPGTIRLCGGHAITFTEGTASSVMETP